MKRVFLFCAFIVVSCAIYAQSEIQSSMIDLLEHSASAPNTASLGKYFEVPVNMSNGLPSIQIPLYTIKTGNITLPIFLTYHGGGVKVNDPPSWVGIGWNLNCGGVVNKQINGLDDYYSTLQLPSGQTWAPETNYYSPSYTIDGDLGFHSMTALVDSLNSAYGNTGHGVDLMKIFGRVIQNKYDGEADQYFFSNPESSGMFFWDQVREKYQTDNINGWLVEGGPAGGWSLKNKTGVSYIYGAAEKTMTPYLNNYSNPNNLYSSAWYLNSIYDARNNRGINIHYDVSAIHESYQGEWAYTDLNSYGGSSWYYFGGSTASNYRYGADLTPDTIYFNEGRVLLIKDTAARLDIVGPKALKEIRVIDNNGTLKKKFAFTYYYHASRLFLQSVQEIDFNLNSPLYSRPYSFVYDTLSLPPRFSYAQDKYGYYNGKTSNTTSLPTEYSVYDLTGWRFADRYIDTNYVKAGTLTQIVYPTGGTLNFQYEPNKDFQDTLVGGLRIKRVFNYDSLANKKLMTEYRYVRSDGSPSGEMQYKPKFSYWYGYFSGNTSYGIQRISTQPMYPLFSNQGSPIAYSEVEKYEIGDSVNLKSKYYFSNYLTTGSDLPYTLTYQSEGLNGVPYNKYPNLGNFNGLNTRKEIFKYKNGQYYRIAADSTIFSSLNHFKSYIWNVQAAWSFEGLTWVIWVDNPDPYMQNPMNSTPALNAYQLFHESLVDKEGYSKAYDENGGYSEQAVFKIIDSTNGNLKKVRTLASNGDTLNTYYTYIADLPETTSSNPYNLEVYNLQQANMTGLPVEIISTKKPAGGTEMVEDAHLYIYDTARLKKHFRLNKEIAYASMTKAYLDNSGFFYDSNYELENEIISFDTLYNPEQIKFRDKTQSIIWDNDKITAVALNTDVHDLAATSFETNAKGRWSYTKHPVIDYTAITGTHVYNLDSSNVTCSSMQAGKSYTVSYWSKTGGKSVNSTSGTSLRTANGWTYYEHQVTNPSGGVIIVSGSGKIDELRLRPTGALMNTYTYEPLLGMSSQCGPNNIITYYEYDGMGRLSLVRDQDRNIVKKICYGLSGQTENCSLFGNQLRTASYTKNNCGADSVGTVVIDTIFANTYFGKTQAIADSLALNALNMNGQTYANTHGSCIYQPCTSTTCPGPDKKCISGYCQEGGIKYLTSVRNKFSSGWTCTYVYCFHDGTVSAVQTNTNSPVACSPIGICAYY